MGSSLREKIEKSIQFIHSISSISPKVAIILGTGLGGLVEHIDIRHQISYSQIPHFPVSTAPGHKGELIVGNIEDKDVLIMDGRFHYYEGYSMEEITFPVRVARKLGAEYLIVSNACGGLNPQYEAGDIMIIEDHINLMGTNPLIGPNDEWLGPRFPDMCEPYSKRLIKIAEKIALENRIKVHKGVYVGLTGPSLETRAEYRFLRIIGADVVGMSTVPEVIVAVHCGLKVLGLSVITDMCLPDALEPVDIDKILKIAKEAEPGLTTIVKGVIKEI